MIGDICAFSAAAKPCFLIRKPEVAFCDPKAHARVGLEWKALFLTPPRVLSTLVTLKCV